MRKGPHLAVSDSSRSDEHVPHAILIIQEGIARLGNVGFDDFQREGEEGGPDDEVAEEHLDGLVAEDAANRIDDLLCRH